MPGPDVAVKARALPAGADHHADGGDLVFRLDDGELVLLRLRINAQVLAMRAEGFGKRGGRRDRVPGGDGRAAIDAAERRGIVAADEDAVAHLVALDDIEPAGAGQMLRRVVETEPKRLHVRRDQ